MKPLSAMCMDETCRKCGGELAPGIAIENTLTGVGDFGAHDVVTLSPGGPGRLAYVLKCKGCGYSVTRGPCMRCGEDFGRDEECEFISPGFFHVECAARMVIGGANHLLGRCTCCGGTEPPDDPTLTKREAARTALAIYRAQNAPKGYHGE